MENLADIDRIVRIVARRQRLSREQEEDLASEVRLALVKNDYEILARFKGLSSLRAFLVTVVHRLFLDQRRRDWGKWRPSRVAQRLGPLALRLEALLFKNGVPVEQAIRMIRTSDGASCTDEELTEIASRLPTRSARRFLGDLPLTAIAAKESDGPEAQLESTRTAARVQKALSGVLASLSAEDQLLLRLRFQDQVSVANIARALRLNQRRLYRRMETLMTQFRNSMQNHGLEWLDVERMLERGQCHLSLAGDTAETTLSRTSNTEEQP